MQVVRLPLKFAIISTAAECRCASQCTAWSAMRWAIEFTEQEQPA